MNPSAKEMALLENSQYSPNTHCNWFHPVNNNNDNQTALRKVGCARIAEYGTSGKISGNSVMSFPASSKTGREPANGAVAGLKTSPTAQDLARGRGGAPRPKKRPSEMKGHHMKNELEIEFQMNEMFGLDESSLWSSLQSLQKSTDAIDGFFERLEMKESLGLGAGDFEKLVAERISRHDEPAEVVEFRELVKAEKAKVPTMTGREMRSSMINVLRKAADAMAAV